MQNTNPVILDSNGEGDVWLSAYTKLVLFDANGNLVWSKDNISSQAQIQPSALQWVPQTTTPSYLGPTQFSVPGNQTATFAPGTAVQAVISGGPIIGIVQTSVTGGTPLVTTVSVAWYSTQLNVSLTAIYTGIVAGGVPGSTPVMPTRTANSANYTLQPSDLFQTFMASNAANLTLPAANSVPPGSYYDFFNIAAANATIIGTINGSANLALAQNVGKRVFSDGTSWWAK